MQERMLKIKRKMDKEIEARFHNENTLTEALYKSAIYSVSGGKRIRAIFAYLLSDLFEIPEEKMLHTACALELVHAASLIMDDLPYMDDAQLRRGKPANHVVFGQDVALLASIGLIAEAAKVTLNDPNLSSDERNQITAALTASYGFDGLASGQFVDLKLKRKNIDFEIIEFINRMKTAALFTAAAKMTAIIGKATDEQMKAVVKFSQDIGAAFQIIDDMLDIAGDEKIIGKQVGQDKMNFVKLVGKEKAQEYLEEYHGKALNTLDIFGDNAGTLKQFSGYLITRAK